jgi:PAS domain S-box-containing protein
MRASVLVLLSVGLVPALAGMAWHLQQQREQALRQAYSRSELLNNGLSANLARVLTDARAVMSAIGARPKVVAVNSRQCDPVFREVASIYPNYTSVVLIRTDGETVCPDLGASKPSPEKTIRQRIFREAIARQAFYPGDAVLAPLSGRWTAPLTYPVIDSTGRQRGILALPLDLEKLANQLFSTLQKSDYAAVIDSTDHVLLCSLWGPQRIGKSVAAPLLQTLAELKGDQLARPPDSVIVRKFSAAGSDGVERLYFARSLPMSDWWVVTGVPRKETLQDYVTLRNRSIAAMGLVFVLAALIGWHMARRIIRPLNELALAAQSIAAGNVAGRARESAPGELGVVAREFNRMLDTQRVTQQQLREGEEQYRALFHAAPVPSVILTVPERRVMDLNEACCQFFGVIREAVLGRTPEETGVVLLAEDRRRFDHELTTQRRVRGLVGQVRMRSGEWREALLSAERIQYGGQRCLLIISMDLTNLRQAERSREELATARAASRAKTEFLSRMSHELRTPLNAVLGFSQILQMDRRLPADVQMRVGHILTAGKHLLSLVDELLDLARIESGNLALALEPVQLAPLLRECLTLCQPLSIDKAIVLPALDDTFGAAPGADFWVQADRTRLRQVLVNLLSNAIKYNRPGGSVALQVEQIQADANEAEVQVTVIDTGRGMSEQQMAKLYEPFNRLGAEFGAEQGYGIGLVIARRLAQAMGGGITARSSPGLGSEFTVHLKPWVVAAPEHAAAARPHTLPRPATLSFAERPDGSVTRKLRVLSVEDNPANQSVVAELFALRSHLELLTAADGAAAMALAHSGHPDLLLIDLNLPDMDGFELLRRLRSEVVTSAIPCWAVTADAVSETANKVRAAGFDAYLSKPFAADEFLRRIDRWAREALAAYEEAGPP